MIYKSNPLTPTTQIMTGLEKSFTLYNG